MKRINPKKIPYYLLLALLVIGASLIIGFLSFGGMFAVWPSIALAFAAFVLSVIYEAEIYLQNLKGALNKLFFKKDYLRIHLALEYLNEKLTNSSSDESDKHPQFIKNYIAQLEYVENLKHSENQLDQSQLKPAMKRLKLMEKWFAKQLFSKKIDRTAIVDLCLEEEKELSQYENELQRWLILNQKYQQKVKYNQRQNLFTGLKIFCCCAGLFMGFGTIYLLAEYIAIIPVLAAIPVSILPFVIVPMAILAGIAYGLLTYNAFTDMFNKQSIVKELTKIKNANNFWIALVAVSLIAIAVILTLCTAGTWLTIANKSQPLFAWMKNIPTFVMGIINPIIIGFASLGFIVENTAESIHLIRKWFKRNKNKEDASKKIDEIIQVVKTFLLYCAEYFFDHSYKNNWQKYNPFHLLLKFIILPLRIVLYLGHVISIGVTTDQMEGVPPQVLAGFGTVSEFFEDLHYFFGHNHDHEHTQKKDKIEKLLKARLKARAGHSHNHTADIPTQILKYAAFGWLYVLAAMWDYAFSLPEEQLTLWQAFDNQVMPKTDSANQHIDTGAKLLKYAAFGWLYGLGAVWDCLENYCDSNSKEQLALSQAFNKLIGKETSKLDSTKSDEKQAAPHQPPVLDQWKKAEVLYQVKRYKKAHLQNAFFAKDKLEKMNILEKDIVKVVKDNNANLLQVKDVIKTHRSDYSSSYNAPRFFNTKKTTTAQFLDDLSLKAGMAA